MIRTERTEPADAEGMSARPASTFGEFFGGAEQAVSGVGDDDVDVAELPLGVVHEASDDLAR
jgi:hypothetical protein